MLYRDVYGPPPYKKKIVPANVTDWYIKEKANLGAAAIKLYTIQILP